jgi:hypothetical protein
MSEVQKRVLKMMPQLAGQKLRGEATEAARERGEKVDVEEGREWEGRQDLLVKAKTGTGKTLVCASISCVNARAERAVRRLGEQACCRWSRVCDG